MDLVLSLILGTAIGLSLGALGGGGSILTVPALVYALGVSARHATGASLLIVGLSALLGMLAHGRAGRVRWAPGLTVGLISIVGSLGGTALNRRVNPDLLLLIFALLMFIIAATMIRRNRAEARRVLRDAPRADADLVAASRVGEAGATNRGGTAAEIESVVRRRSPLLVATVGVGVGFLTGFLGVGGGFIVVPSLVLVLGFQLAEAVGTSLLIIAISSAFAIAERGGVHGVPAQILWPFAGSAMIAALVGNQIAERVPVRRLNQGFVLLVIAVACYVAVRSVLALT